MKGNYLYWRINDLRANKSGTIYERCIICTTCVFSLKNVTLAPEKDYL
jgi:hypothetical protein